MDWVVADPYTPRIADAYVERLFSELPALMLTGPRAAGKTTTARRHARTVVRLDRDAEAGAFRADPDAALAALPEPILLDEWQAVPGVLAAVKRTVDDVPRPGRFLLTGSVQADLLGETWPGTGRVVRIRMDGLTMRELDGALRGPSFVARLAADDLDALALPEEVPDLRGYVALALRGGFPEPALRLSPGVGQAWLEGYLHQLLTRDVEALAEVRDPDRLRRYFEAVALNTAGLPEHKTLYDAAGINRKTAVAYDQLLTNLFVLESLPAWASNRLTRLVKGPKRHLVDPSLMAAALRLDDAALMRDGDLLGRLIETFVLAQIRPEVQLGPGGARLYHLRDRNDRREIDLLIELPGGDVVAIEVKATAAPDSRDARHLVWLREALGDRFLGGAVLHTGPRLFALSERIAAVPICALWGS
jgi:predicted AAA+ superfamily ATPase